jgi:hypothetical protein
LLRGLIIIDKLIDVVIGPLVGAVSGYFNLPAYGKIVYNKFIGNIKKYNQENDFWRDAIGPYFYMPAERNLYDGQLVELNNFEITEWFPRCPGLFWTKDAYESRNHAAQYIDRTTDRYIVLSPYGKTLMVLGGRGTTRLEVHTDNYNYKVLCATSSGRCDAGIPLVVSRGVYDEIRDELHHDGSIRADLSGFYSPFPMRYDELIWGNPGAELPSKVRSWLANSLHIPKYCLKVESRLSVRKKKSESSIQATAWTLFNLRNQDNPEKALPPSFVFWSFDPRFEDSIEEATNEIKNYIQYFGTGEILTDFDERVQRFVSKYPLSDIMHKRMDIIREQNTEYNNIFNSSRDLTDVMDY